MIVSNFDPYGKNAVSGIYINFSLGYFCLIDFKTVNPPKPLSKIPILEFF